MSVIIVCLFYALVYTNHTEAGDTEAGDTVLCATGMHVAGLLALWPLQPLGNAIRLIHYMGVNWILNPALHVTIFHPSAASGRALAVDVNLVGIFARLPGVRINSNRSCRVYGMTVDVQAKEVLMAQSLDRDTMFIISTLLLYQDYH